MTDKKPEDDEVFLDVGKVGGDGSWPAEMSFPDEKDDIETFLETERATLEHENAEVTAELTGNFKRLADAMADLDAQIARAADEGDELLWTSLLNRKQLILQRLSEIEYVLRK